jgi:hypothetical protein
VHVQATVARGSGPAPVVTSERVAARLIELSLLDTEDTGARQDEQGRKPEHGVPRLEPIL